MKEPYQDVVHLQASGEVTSGSETISLTSSHSGQHQRQTRQPSPTKVKLSESQKVLLDRLKERPEVMKLLKVIFSDYPQMVIKEFRQSSPHGSRRQQEQSQQTTLDRLKTEAFIEQQVVMLAGLFNEPPQDIHVELPDVVDDQEPTDPVVPTDDFFDSATTQPVMTPSETTQEELVEAIQEEKSQKKTVKKATKKQK